MQKKLFDILCSCELFYRKGNAKINTISYTPAFAARSASCAQRVEGAAAAPDVRYR